MYLINLIYWSTFIDMIACVLVIQTKIFESCKDHPESYGMITKITLKTPTNGSTLISGEAFVKEKIPVPPMELTLFFKQCKQRNTCEEYAPLTITGMCDILYSKDHLWGHWVESVQPKIICPVKAGVYTFQDVFIDISSLSGMPIDGYTWRVRGEVTTTNKTMVLCIDTEDYILNINKEQKKKKKRRPKTAE